MRRTLTYAALAAVLAVPAAAMAAPGGTVPGGNASISNCKGGNGAVWNGHGNPHRCKSAASTPVDTSSSGSTTTAPPLTAPAPPAPEVFEAS